MIDSTNSFHRCSPSNDASWKAEHGFSVVELLVVFAVAAILLALTVFAFSGHRNAYRTEDQALHILDYVRIASNRALTQRKSVRLEINYTTNQISIIDDKGTPTNFNDDTLVRREPLEPLTRVNMYKTADFVSQPSNVTPIPPSPSNYAAATFALNTQSQRVWAVRFLLDGRVVDASSSPAPVSATLMLWEPSQADAANAKTPKAVRAITIYGGTGVVRYWKYNGTAFING